MEEKTEAAPKAEVKEVGSVGVKVEPTEPQRPTVGRMVHYYRTPEEQPLASTVAFVDKVEGDPYAVTLCVITAGGPRMVSPIPFSQEPKAGHWSWPAIK